MTCLLWGQWSQRIEGGVGDDMGVTLYDLKSRWLYSSGVGLHNETGCMSQGRHQTGTLIRSTIKPLYRIVSSETGRRISIYRLTILTSHERTCTYACTHLQTQTWLIPNILINEGRGGLKSFNIETIVLCQTACQFLVCLVFCKE